MPSLNTIFTIVVCGQVSNISWKSLISDGPDNFFTRHFLKSTSRIAHIDRNPDTFQLIVKHLRGYPIIPKDECQHQDLLNDAVYFGLRKLIEILKEYVHVNIGGASFRLKWDLFNKDGPHNYFTGPLKHSLYAPHVSIGEAMPICIERDPEIFKDMIRHLQGYEIHIKDEQHRLQLLSDAEFYLFRRLRDKLKCSMTEKAEIILNAKDIRPALIEQNGHVYYKQDQLYLLAIQLLDFNISYHTSNQVFLLEQDIKLPKDPRWVISKLVEIDKDCAIVFGQQNFGIQHYTTHLNNQKQRKHCSLHTDCELQWFGVEKAIASVNNCINKSLSISFIKMEIIGSRTQANMKRNFLIRD